MSENKMLVFDDPTDFLNFMDHLQKEYNKNQEKENKNINVGGVNHE